MKICRIKKTNVYDVFIGDGWKNHARFYFKGDKLSFIGTGNTRLSHEQMQTLQIRLLLGNENGAR